MDFVQLFRILPKTHSTWSIADTTLWLGFIGLSHLAPDFQKCSIDGSILGSLSEEDFREQLHIESKVILKKLLNWVTTGIKQFDLYVVSTSARAAKNQPKTMQHIALDKEEEGELMLTRGNKVKAASVVQPLREGTHSEKMKRTEKNELIVRQCETNQVVSNYSFIEKGGSIGKQNNNDIVVLTDVAIERRHADIVYCEGNYYIKDCASQAGTFLKVTEKKPIFDGIILEMGSYQFLVQINSSTDLSIRVIDAPVEQEEVLYTFPKMEKMSLGRKESNEINFPDDQHMSGMHAKLFKVEGVWYVQDMATTNGTWIRLSRENTESVLYLLEDQAVFKLGSNSIYECHRNKGNRKTYKEKEDKCIFCLKQEKNAIFLPCKHSIACVDCVELLKIDRCNLCESGVQEVIKIYTS